MGHKTRKGVLYTTAILLPPLAIFFQHGTDQKHFGLNVLLTLLGWYVVIVPPSPFLTVTPSPNKPEPAARMQMC